MKIARSIVIGGLALLGGWSLAQAQDFNFAATGGSGKPEKTEINLGYTQTADHGPLVLGIKEGFFQAEGLTVNVRPVNSSNSPTALVSGDLDAANITWIQYLTAAKNGIFLQSVAEASRGAPGYTAFVVKSDSPVQKAEDLLGKKVGVIVTNGICDFMLNDRLKSKGLVVDSIRYTTLPVPNLASTLLSGGVDAVCLPEPFLTSAKEQGGVRVLFDLFSDMHAKWPITTYGVSADFAKKNPNTVGALQRALAKSRKFANDNPDKLRAILPTYARIDPALAGKIALPEYPMEDDPQAGVKRTTDLFKRINFLQ